MPLDKKDLKQIKEIVTDTVKVANKDLRIELKKDIYNLEDKFTSKIEASKNEVISTLTREVNDLADINRAVITTTDQLDYRLRIVERKIGLKSR